MKTYILAVITSLLIACAAAHAGAPTEATQSKETVTPQPGPTWYADHEWNLDLFGAYAFTGTPHANDRYLGVDHAFGGGVDAKYFFARYFGIGIEGYVLDANRTRIDQEGTIALVFPAPFFTGVKSRTNDAHAVGAALGTFTFRYPLPGSRFAPYAFIGGGGVFGGGQQDIRIFSGGLNEVQVRTEHIGSSSRFVAEFGGGFEVRLTPHIGLINDFTWNIIDGAKNNFGMVRSGINFAF
jgi:opacity protein-like surface antigen